MNRFLSEKRSLLNSPVPADALVVFRIAYGLLISISAARFLHYGWATDWFSKPSFVFSFYGFSWIPKPSFAVARILFFSLVLLGLLVSLGAQYKISLALLLAIFGYLQLVDVTNYLNHYYLVWLLGFLLFFMPLGEFFSVDSWLYRRRHKTAARRFLPYGYQWALRAQVGTVYFFAGMAKFHSDWLLHAMPLRIWLSARSDYLVVNTLIRLISIEKTAYFFSWAGFLFDTSIPLFLLCKRTRPYAYGVVIFFHCMTQYLFPIGMFPSIMVFSALVFFEPDWPKRLLGEQLYFSFLSPAQPVKVNTVHKMRPILAYSFVFYIFFQWLMPLRYLAYGDSVLWHEQGMRFSWRVMAREKNGDVEYELRDPKTGRKERVGPKRYLTDRQLRDFSTQPDLILQLGKKIGREFEALHGVTPEVKVEAYVSLNGRGASLLIDPSCDLMQVQDSLFRASYILPKPSISPPRLH